MGRSPMEAKRNAGEGYPIGLRPTVNHSATKEAPAGWWCAALPLRGQERRVPLMPLRALKNRYLKRPESPFFTRSGKIFNQINHLWSYTSYKVKCLLEVMKISESLININCRFGLYFACSPIS